MADFHQNGVISTLHNFSHRSIEDIENELLKLEWEEFEGEDEFLEFKLSRSEVTSETILLLTAFCDADEVEQEKQFWETQMEDLRRASGG